MIVAISMNPMPPKVIGKELCLHVRGLFGLSKDLGPKRCPNTWRKEESKEVKDSMMVEGGVHHKKYEGHWMKQRVRIPKAT